MVTLVLVVGGVVAAVAGALVYADAAGRDLPSGGRLRWAAGVAAASFAAFAIAAGLDATLVRVYAALSGRPAVVTRPRQLVVSLVGVGLAVTAVAVLAYGFGSRHGPLRAA